MRESAKRQLWPVLLVRKLVSHKRIAAVVLCLAISSFAAGPAPPSSEDEFEFHSLVPLGIEGFTFGSSGRSFYLMALAEQPALEGLHRLRVDSHRVLLDAQGHQVNYFPAQVSFRVTATTWADKLSAIDMTPVETQPDTNHFLLNLRFRLKIFRGLKVRMLAPSEVRLIGMPADVSYNERIYSVSFDIGHVPVEDRMVLEVLSPSGERLCKFHLDLT